MNDERLLQVEKPARYIGNEINMVEKNPQDVDVRFGFCFPDVYEVGMSHLGMQILYYFLNRREDVYCERVFAPWGDMEAVMRRENIPLFALETGDAVKEFDILGFTLQYEMSYTNIINMLDLAGIAILAANRGEDSPIICAGGPCTVNPEPLADMIDFFYVGEGEASYDKILDIYKQNKKELGSRKDFLEKILSVEGVYVPSFYDVEYNEDGSIKSFEPNHPLAPKKIKKAMVKDFDGSFFPEKQLTPLMEIVHDRSALELFRGCIRGCRFCQAGYIYRPVREKRHETLLKQAESLIESSGQEEISLLSLSTGDYTEFKPLAEGLLDRYEKDQVNISLPSLRVDAFTLEIMEKTQKVRKSSLTFAPEAGTQRLRDVINKGVSEEEILEGCKLAFEGGWDKVKLYFMTGLPTETEEDLTGIGQLAEKIVDKYYLLPLEKRRRPVSVNVSVSYFVPKPFTPFQWEAQDTWEQFMDKQKIVKRSIYKKQIKCGYSDARTSVMEGVIARGDRKVGKAIVRAWELGARFDGWTEFFKYDVWMQAFQDVGVQPFFYTRQIPKEANLPWDHIDVGVTKGFLLKEAERAYEEHVTPNCRENCSGCGISKGGVTCGA